MCKTCNHEDVLATARANVETAGDLGERVEAAFNFCMSVSSKSEDIAETISNSGHVTVRQRDALENMSAGLAKWDR